jgi:hypothetical protein
MIGVISNNNEIVIAISESYRIIISVVVLISSRIGHNDITSYLGLQVGVSPTIIHDLGMV